MYKRLLTILTMLLLLVPSVDGATKRFTLVIDAGHGGEEKVGAVKQGIEEKVVTLLGTACPIPAVYAGGVRSMEDLDRVRTAGRDRVDVTIGSALDLFGGALAYRKVKEYFSQE